MCCTRSLHKGACQIDREHFNLKRRAAIHHDLRCLSRSAGTEFSRAIDRRGTHQITNLVNLSSTRSGCRPAERRSTTCCPKTLTERLARDRDNSLALTRPASCRRNVFRKPFNIVTGQARHQTSANVASHASAMTRSERCSAWQVMGKGNQRIGAVRSAVHNKPHGPRPLSSMSKTRRVENCPVFRSHPDASVGA